jgi:hypothetical protein
MILSDNIFQRSVTIGQVKKDIQFISISKAWDKLMRMMEAKKLIFDSSASGWMRFKHPNKNKYIQLSCSSRLINSGTENEDFIESISINFYTTT